MSQIDIDSDGSVNIRKWLVAIGFDNPLTFTFLTAAGAAFDITGYVFSLQVKKKGQSSNLFNYTEGNGLTNNGAAGTLSSTALNYIHSATLKNRGEYFVQLSVTLPSGDKRRWYNGTVYASSELHDDTVASVSTTIDIGGTVISTTVEIGGPQDHFRGTYTTLVALQAAVPTGNPGDYADVDAGAGTDVQRYIWDDDDDDWILGGGAASGDVVGPASAVDSRMVEFDGTTGKLIKDGGVVVSAFAKTVLDDANAAAALSTLGAVATSLEINDQTLTGDLLIPSPLIYRFSGLHYSNNINCGAAINYTLANNSMRAFAFVVEREFTFNNFRTEVQTLAGSTSYRVGIYTSNASTGYPDALVSNTDLEAYDSTSTGLKVPASPQSVTLIPGLYYIAVNANGAPSLRGFAAAGLPPIRGLFGTVTNINTSITELRVAQAYGAMPATFPAGASEFSFNSITLQFDAV